MRARGVSLLLPLLALGCGGADFVYFESITSGPNPGATLIVVWMSDSPADDAEALEVSVRRVELLGPQGAISIATGTSTFDLLALQNGARRKLAEANVAPGSYERVRITLGTNAALAPRVRRGGLWQPLGYVSSSAHVIEVPYAITAVADQTVQVQIDFNARTSLLDHEGELQLDPQLDALDPEFAGSIGGIVRADLGAVVPDAIVVAYRAGVEVRSTRTRADGSFLLTPLTPGAYDLRVETPLGPQAARDGIAVVSGETTDITLTLP